MSVRTQRLLKYSLLAVALLLLVGLICLIQAARTALDAEHTLHANYLILGLVEQYVEQSGQWPKDWQSLEQTPFENGGMWEWPKDSTEIQQRITIDFSTTLIEVEAMEPDRFSAIRQRDPHFVMEGEVASFLDSIRNRQQGVSP